MAKDLTGIEFGRLLSLRIDTDRKGYWVCRCSCGAEKSVAASNLCRGATKSCGCLDRELKSARALQQRLPEGAVYGAWTIVGDPIWKPQGSSGKLESYYIAMCICGTEKRVKRANLVSGVSSSCGCLRSELSVKNRRSHKETGSKLYAAWMAMRDRCSNPNNKRWKNYGGRGITVCEEWRDGDSYPLFASWSRDNGYAEGLSIDRENNDKGYSPKNCRWIPLIDQQSNRSNNVQITAFGETKTIGQWSRDARCKASRSALNSRLKKPGVCAEYAIVTPTRVRNPPLAGNA